MFGTTGSMLSRFSSKGSSSGGGSADAIAGRVTRDQWSHYLEQFGPLESQLVSEVNSNDMVTGAVRDSSKQNAIAEQSFDRDKSRYGVNMTGVQGKQMERMRSLGDAANNTYAINNTRLEQRDRNISLGGDLMQIGRGVAGQGIDGLGQAAGMAAQRNAANAQAKAQASAQSNQMLGTMVGIGLSFL